MFWSLTAALIVILIYRAIFPAREDKYWNGPKPTEQERTKAQNWIVDHIVEYPNSTQILRHDFPEASKKADAIIRYRNLENLRTTGQISEKDYETELEKILPHIDITRDLAHAG